MKRCPKCGSTYSDETLSFCLSDGAALLEIDGQKTEEMSSDDRGEMRIDIPRETVPFQTPAPATSVEPEKKASWPYLFGFLAAVLLLGVILASVTVVYFVFDKEQPELSSNTNREPDKEVEALKKKIEELREKVEEKGSTSPLNANETPKDKSTPAGEVTPIPDSTVPAGFGVVNSPADGFLALRTLPNHKTGARIAKIPHGTTIALSGCQASIKIAKRTGRWCRTTYAGKSGWIFDAWVQR